MSLKHVLCSGAFITALIPSGVAAPAVALGDDVALFVTAGAELAYDTNVFSDDVFEESDIRYSFNPGISIGFGSPGSLVGNINASVDFVNFMELNDLGGEYISLSFDSEYVSGPLVTNAAVSFNESYTSDPDVTTSNRGILNDVELIAGNGGLRYAFSELLSGSVALEYNETDYEQSTLFDTSSIALPIRGFYRITPRTDVTASFRYREVEATRDGAADVDYSDIALTVGVAGELFSPLWQGDVQLGWQERDLDGGDTNDGIYYRGAVTYTPTRLQIYTVSILRDFNASSSNGENFARGTGTFSATYLLTPQFSAGFDLRYSESNYENSARDINNYGYGLRVSYSPNDYLDLGASFNSTNVEAEGSLAQEFERNVFAVRASFRY